MLELIFGSQTRAKLIKFFCTNPDRAVHLRDLARILDIKVSALSRELGHLSDLGLISSTYDGQRRYYVVDQQYPLFPELRALMVKSLVLLERAVAKKLKSVKGIKLLVLTGVFNATNTETDILIVANGSQVTVERLVALLSRTFYHDLRFTLLTQKEYAYRRDVNDKFIAGIMSASPIIVIDRMR